MVVDPKLAESALAEAPQRYHLVVGVDFGTTYSGVSYIPSMHNDIRHITEFTQWPGVKGVNSLATTARKTPSRIAYAEENNLSMNQWGYQVQAGKKQYSWMKLHLDKGAPPTQYDDAEQEKDMKEGLPGNRKAEDVTSDYLKELYRHIIGELEKKITKDVLRVTTIKFWMTKPVIWSDQAEVQTRRAAEKAGFGTRPGDEICLILEPEAAALATISGMAGEYETSINHGDSIVVCDCGGGTVDLNSYIVEEKGGKLGLRESSSASGGKCGGTSVDRNLRKWMSQRYGEAFDSLSREITGPGSEFMSKFEYNKRMLGTDGDLVSMVLDMEGVEDDDYYDEDYGDITLTKRIMEQLFDPVIDKIKNLIQSQIDRVRSSKEKPVQKLFMVGGFGDSSYLRQKVAAYFLSQDITLNVLPEGKSWSAIAKGAVIRGLERATVDKRICRRNYGIEILQQFREGIDHERDVYDSPFDGKMAMGYMDWCVKKGTEINNETQNLLELCTDLDPNNDNGSLELVTLYSSDDDKAPERIDVGSVKKVGSIVVDLSSVDITKLGFKVTADGLVDLQYKINVMLGDRQGTICFECLVGDETVGTADIDFTKNEIPSG